MHRVLIVEDEQGLRDLLVHVIAREGFEAVGVRDGEEAQRALDKELYDIVLTDIRLPGADGLTVLRTVKALSPHTLVLMMTAYASTETAVQAMREGAYDYLTKPFNLEELIHTLRNALDAQRLKQENRLLRQELETRAAFDGIVAKSDKMRKAVEIARKVANTTSTVLILGESGVGKEVLARAIHFNSDRRDHPFVTINCSALPEPLLESELFGHVKGAFTGAVVNKAGLFEEADGGTAFLDEIGELSGAMQVKLLRVLQDREFRRVGGTKDIKVDVRIIAATNRDLQRAVAEGQFREDLYYRLDVIPLVVPPLRNRYEDIPLLAEHFLAKHAKTAKKQFLGIHRDALELLCAQPWRGNVRELENMIERIVTISAGPWVTADTLKDCLGQPLTLSTLSDIPPDGVDLDALMTQIEKDLLVRALEKSRWVKTNAAKLLRVNFRSLRYRLAKHGIGKERSPS